MRPRSSPARRCGAPTATCCARAARTSGSATSPLRADVIARPYGAPRRSLHAARPCCPASSPPSSRSKPTSRVSTVSGEGTAAAGARPCASRPRTHGLNHARLRSHDRRRSRLTASPTPTRSSTAGNTQLVVACLVGIAAVVLLITLAEDAPVPRPDPRLRGARRGRRRSRRGDILTSFITGFGSTTGAVGVLIALGAMIGKILADSGGADTGSSTGHSSGTSGQQAAVGDGR